MRKKRLFAFQTRSTWQVGFYGMGGQWIWWRKGQYSQDDPLLFRELSFWISFYVQWLGGIRFVLQERLFEGNFEQLIAKLQKSRLFSQLTDFCGNFLINSLTYLIFIDSTQYDCCSGTIDATYFMPRRLLRSSPVLSPPPPREVVIFHWIHL